MINESNVAGNDIAPNSTARSRRHRESLKRDCARLDITVGADVAEKLRTIAKKKGVPLWQVVEEAIEALSISGGGLTTPNLAVREVQ